MQSHISNYELGGILADNFAAEGGIAYDMRDHIRVTDGKECALTDFAVHAEAYGFFRAADHLL